MSAPSPTRKFGLSLRALAAKHCIAPEYSMGTASRLNVQSLEVREGFEGCRGSRQQLQRQSAPISSIDILSTLAELFGTESPKEITGKCLVPLLGADGKGHDAAVSEIFGGPLLISDGRIAFHYRPNLLDCTDLNEYRILPMRMRGSFSVQELRHVELTKPFVSRK